MYKKNLIHWRSRFTIRKKIPTYNFFTNFLIITYTLCFWVLKSALNVVSVSILDDLRYLFENACCQPVRMDVIINVHQFLSWFIFLQFILFCQLKKASALIFLLSNYTDINRARSFSMRWISKSAQLWSLLTFIFTRNLAAEFAEYEPRPRTVNSAM